MIKPIVTVPETVLRTVSKDVVIDKKVRDFISDLSATLFAKTNPKGVGLSAPQLGKNWNLFVTWLAPDPDEDPSPADLRLFINPIITGHSSDTTFGPDVDDPILEGCLSIPNLYGPVPRYSSITVSYQTMGKDPESIIYVEKTFKDFEARVVQHEYDHLKGKLFTDYSLEYDLPVYEFVGKKMKEIDKNIIKAF